MRGLETGHGLTVTPVLPAMVPTGERRLLELERADIGNCRGLDTRCRRGGGGGGGGGGGPCKQGSHQKYETQLCRSNFVSPVIVWLGLIGVISLEQCSKLFYGLTTLKRPSKNKSVAKQAK